MELITGDIVKTNSFKANLPPNDIISRGSVTFKVTDKKTQFIFMFLGIEPIDKQEAWADYDKRLNALGWVYDPTAAMKIIKDEI